MSDGGCFFESYDYFWFKAACADARSAMGTRKGEQLT